MAAATQNIQYKSKQKEHKTQHKHTMKIEVLKKREKKKKNKLIKKTTALSIVPCCLNS